MSLSENQRAIQGTSIANRRRGLRANVTRLANLKNLNSQILAVGAALVSYDNFQMDAYGGRVERTVLRTPLSETLGNPETIDFNQAMFELSGWAQVEKTAGTDFEGYEGKQVRYLLTLDEMFMFPTFASAIAELLDEGIEIRTRKAVYRLAARRVIKD
jgi:hypothetical protein